MTKPRHNLTRGLVGCVADPPPPALCASRPTPGPSRGFLEAGSQDAQAGAPTGGPRIRHPGSRDSARAVGEPPPVWAPSAAVLAAARPCASQSLPSSQVWRWVLLCWDLSRACGLHTSRGSHVTGLAPRVAVGPPRVSVPCVCRAPMSTSALQVGTETHPHADLTRVRGCPKLASEKPHLGSGKGELPAGRRCVCGEEMLSPGGSSLQRP